MGEHSTWFDFLFASHTYQDLFHNAEHTFGRGPGTANPWKFAMFDQTHFTLNHVLGSLLVFLFLLWGALSYRNSVKGVFRGERDAVVPPPQFNRRNLFEMFADGVMNLMESVMGKKNARRYFPLIASLAFFILFNNLLALIPGFTPPTDTVKTNLALSAIVFLATHYYGVREGGLKYFKHFLGPIWWLAPLMLPIELISHIARPASLALRLTGNMASDHKVVAAFFTLIPILIPVPFLVLGVMVAIVQTLVFSLLSMVYISMAVQHDEHH